MLLSMCGFFMLQVLTFLDLDSLDPELALLH